MIFLNSNITCQRQSLWNRSLTALFIILFFLEGVTRYKHLISGLMYITALYYIVIYRKNVFKQMNNSLFISLSIFVAAIIYSVFISIDPAYSIDKAANKIFEQLLLVSIVIPVLLHKETKESAAKLMIFSLIIAFIPLIISDGILYYHEYAEGIMPFSGYEHKYKSDALIFISPALLYLWGSKNRNYRVAFLFILPILGFVILGTMQRGTWLAIIIPATIWFILKRKWKLPLTVILVFAAILSFIAHHDPQPFNTLFSKMQQTSSSNRYGGGTQGSALDLILENPVKGYGYGDDIFYRVYNDEVKLHPEWIFKKSIGPHNVTLVYWYAGGIFGLLALWYLFFSIIKEGLSGYKVSYGIVKDAWLVIIMIIIGDFLVRGLFESVAISNLAILFGISQALLFLPHKKP